MKHYEHMEPVIAAFFREHCIEVALEPSGSRGPDISGINVALVGEIKHAVELRRDLRSTFWSAWNSPAQKFGGKVKGFVLGNNLPDDAGNCSPRAKGWLAVIFGQLRYMVRAAGLSEGWLVFAEAAEFISSLREALDWLAGHGLVSIDGPHIRQDIGFVKVTFRSFEV